MNLRGTRITKNMKNLDVLFVHPNGAPIIYQELSNSYSAIEPPIWAALLAKNAIVKGFSARILDCEAERIGAEESAKRVIEHIWIAINFCSYDFKR